MSKLQFYIRDDGDSPHKYAAVIGQYPSIETFDEMYTWCNAILGKNWKVGMWEWSFATEADRTMFLLRWG